MGKESFRYWCRFLASDFGRAVELQKWDDAAEAYHVLLSGDGRHSCECKGFLHHGHCKHVEGLAALLGTAAAA